MPKRGPTPKENAQTVQVYDDGWMKHLPDTTPGTPYTACGIDAGSMTRKDHPVTHAAMWCTACMRTLAEETAG